jgi:dihydroorotate dehydrogenase
LFRLDAEQAHRLGTRALGVAANLPLVGSALTRHNQVKDARLEQSLLGRTFPNPVGLAAGFDKDAEHTCDWNALGFGFAEIGAVTPRGQDGNARPRLFRLKQSRSIQNAMGFNNAGMELIRERLQELYPLSFPLGINLGKNRETSLEHASEDYLSLISHLEGCCDYFVVNLSSPNTPGLRELENAEYVSGLIHQATRSTLRPVLLKVSPDRPPAETAVLAHAAVDAGAAGIVATNTTVDYSLSPEARQVGGISGLLLREKSYAMLVALAAALKRRALLISVGGIDSPEEAYRRIRAGANLVQVYTGLIYEGPGLVRRINEGLLDFLERDGFPTLTSAIGTDRLGQVESAPAGE